MYSRVRGFCIIILQRPCALIILIVLPGTVRSIFFFFFCVRVLFFLFFLYCTRTLTLALSSFTATLSTLLLVFAFVCCAVWV